MSTTHWSFAPYNDHNCVVPYHKIPISGARRAKERTRIGGNTLRHIETTARSTFATSKIAERHSAGHPSVYLGRSVLRRHYILHIACMDAWWRWKRFAPYAYINIHTVTLSRAYRDQVPCRYLFYNYVSEYASAICLVIYENHALCEHGEYMLIFSEDIQCTHTHENCIVYNFPDHYSIQRRWSIAADNYIATSTI